jgi:hypothetical protein
MESQVQPTALIDSPGQPTALNELMRRVLDNDNYTYRQKWKLLRELRRNNAGVGDRWPYRVAILALAIVAGVAALAIPLLAWDGVELPEGLIALGSAAVGGLAALLTPFQRTRGQDGS